MPENLKKIQTNKSRSDATDIVIHILIDHPDCLFTTGISKNKDQSYNCSAPVFDKHHAELWAVIELFYRYQDGSGIELFKSISPGLLFTKMKAVSPYTKKFGIWEYQTHLYPKSKAPGAKTLNEAYRKWLYDVYSR